MAYPNYNFPQYPQNFQQSFQQNYQQSFPQTQQIQNGGFLPVRSRQEAMVYPVAPGTSVTFKDESAPYIYTKTKGFSQFDEPVFDVYKLTKEDNMPMSPSEAHTETSNNQTENLPQYALKDDLEALQKIVDVLQSEIDALKKKPAQAKKKEVVADE